MKITFSHDMIYLSGTTDFERAVFDSMGRAVWDVDFIRGGDSDPHESIGVILYRRAEHAEAGQQPATQSVRQPDEAASAHA